MRRQYIHQQANNRLHPVSEGQNGDHSSMHDEPSTGSGGSETRKKFQKSRAQPSSKANEGPAFLLDAKEKLDSGSLTAEKYDRVKEKFLAQVVARTDHNSYFKLMLLKDIASTGHITPQEYYETKALILRKIVRSGESADQSQFHNNPLAIPMSPLANHKPFEDRMRDQDQHRDRTLIGQDFGLNPEIGEQKVQTSSGRDRKSPRRLEDVALRKRRDASEEEDEEDEKKKVHKKTRMHLSESTDEEDGSEGSSLDEKRVRKGEPESKLSASTTGPSGRHSTSFAVVPCTLHKHFSPLRNIPDRYVRGTVLDRVGYWMEVLLNGSWMKQTAFLAGVISVICAAWGGVWFAVSEQECDCPADTAGCDCHYPFGVEGLDAFWLSWTFIMCAQYLYVDHIGQRVLVTLMILTGLVLFAVTIGLITTEFQILIGDLNNGKTKVAEKNHVVILGWNSSTASVVAYLAHLRSSHYEQMDGWRNKMRVIANPLLYRRWRYMGTIQHRVFTAKIVVLSSTASKFEMERDIKAAFAQKQVNPKHNQVGRDVICRVGQETSVVSYLKVNTHQAHRVVVMLNEMDHRLTQSHRGGSIPDAVTLQALLALQFVLTSQYSPTHPAQAAHVVAQLSSTSPYIGSANWFKVGSKEPAVSLLNVSHKLDSLIMACSVQPGLGHALQAMLSVEGADMKIMSVQTLEQFYSVRAAGKLFQDIQFLMLNHTVLGLIRGAGLEHRSGRQRRQVLMNPSSSERVFATDELLILGDGDPIPTPLALQTIILDHIERGPTIRALAETRISKLPVLLTAPRILVCGWRQEWNDPAQFGEVLKEVSAYSHKGTTMTFLNTLTDEGRDNGEWPQLLHLALESSGLDPEAPLVSSIKHFVGSGNKPQDLEMVKTHSYDTFVLLSTAKEDGGNLVDINMRDGRVLSSLISISNYMLDYPCERLNFVCEMATEQNRMVGAALSASTHGAFADFVNVMDLVAMLVAQICYRPIMDSVWTELLRSEGSEVHVVSVGLFIKEAEGELFFWEVMKRVTSRSKTDQADVCLGYITCETQHQTCSLAPTLDSKRKYLMGDKLVILGKEALSASF